MLQLQPVSRDDPSTDRYILFANWLCPGHSRLPRVARKRLRHYQRRAIARSGLRAS